MKKTMYCLIVVITLMLYMNHTVSTKSQSLNSHQVFSTVEEVNKVEGTVVFGFKTDFESLAKFLHITEKEFFQFKKEKSLLEIAQSQGISEDELLNYLISVHFGHLRSAYDANEIDLNFIMNYVLHIKEDVTWEIKMKNLLQER